MANLGRPFEKGVSGNPGGRVKGYPEFRKLMREKSPMATERLEEILNNRRHPKLMEAITLCLAYAYGKPDQRVKGVLLTASLEDLVNKSYGRAIEHKPANEDDDAAEASDE